jgi:hypothetical protein
VLFHGGRSISYSQLAALVDGWAAALQASGAGPGVCVALWLPNSPAFVAAFLATLRLGATASFSAVGVDAFGNPIPSLSAAWTLAPGTPGALAPTSGPATTYTATGRIGMGQVVATVTTPTGPLIASAPVIVTPPPVIRVAAVRYGVRSKTLNVYVTVVDARGGRVPNAAVTVFLYRNGKLYARAGGRTVGGRMTFTRPASSGTYRAVVRNVTATGLRWNRKTPVNRFVRPQRTRGGQ